MSDSIDLYVADHPDIEWRKSSSEEGLWHLFKPSFPRALCGRMRRAHTMIVRSETPPDEVICGSCKRVILVHQ